MSEHTKRSRAAATLALLGALILPAAIFGVGAAPAFADPAYSSDGCDINRATDGPIEGGSTCAGADLSGEKLAQSAFQGADLSGANLSKADVQDSNFTGANLAGADFSGTRIVSADFTGAGILPATVDVTAETADGAPVTLTPALPTGLTMTGCTIAGEPVDSGALFPLGQSGVVCSFASSRPNETATALVIISVTNPATTAPPVPVFTQAPAAEGSGSGGSGTTGLPAGTMNILLFGGGGVLLLGIVALIVRGVRGSRGYGEGPGGQTDPGDQTGPGEQTGPGDQTDPGDGPHDPGEGAGHGRHQRY